MSYAAGLFVQPTFIRNKFVVLLTLLLKCFGPSYSRALSMTVNAVVTDMGRTFSRRCQVRRTLLAQIP